MSLIIGRKPVLEALNSDEELSQVFILFGQEGGIIDAIRAAAKKKGIKVNQVPYEKFRQITQSKIAQGVAAIKSSQRYYILQEIIQSAQSKIELHKKALSLGEGLGEAFPLLLILDSIQDTHNVGAILRSADCSGVDGIIVTKHNSAPINETVVKTSAGASEHVKIAQVNNLSQTIDELKQNGFWIVGSYLEGAKDYTKVDYKMPIAVIVGNEEKGIRKLTADKCDYLVRIPMKGKIQSLNVSVATGVLLFEILRQRNI
ncbi:MAG TPA: 23S rRNA (guanosine(2251)-2'-O)-methyltransferase RlmB [Ignavibacteriaceae bacterium]|nr:23S rRNA (guanosine(2251)-2'-O)-methyltransferase RlmB [Ignavibacterium sp.]HRN27331.1 23S rRNA (guanosine(2251)-2'-O)-methyltransferase RlmB [Ignavibacteriaceae bacterium]HRQ54970.1 23S rRNA (guanosine(2251)-2'-O)-methyltransferase RlmB [Ignavibacteriaceae bacterium]